MNEMTTQAPVLFEERTCLDGSRIGIATLNAPKTLNGLSLHMVRLLSTQLHLWAGNPNIVCVVMKGAGNKAFCAGGDLYNLHRSMCAYRDSASKDITSNNYAAEFFEEEYRLDYFIHTYPKPLLCWGNGIVMGGGIGLMSGASHRVVTEHSKLAMPEVAIGLFPDVGGSWLLARVPRGAGLFLALTGARLNASDAIYAGLADVCVESTQDVVQMLLAHRWQGETHADREALTALLNNVALHTPPGPLQQQADVIEHLVKVGSLEQVVKAITSAPHHEDAWLKTAQASLTAGSPGAMRLAWELQHRAANMLLADVFRMECMAILHVAAHGDLAEGIRALLIDKDRSPQWNPATLAQASTQWAEAFLVSPWADDAHPLADLDANCSRSHT